MQSEMKQVEFNLAVGFFNSTNRFPERPALVVNDLTYSYEELSKMSAVISEQIKELTTCFQKQVVLLAHRSPTAYSAILGILSTGGCYVPLHPEYPPERNFKILDQSGSSLIIVGNECLEAFENLLNLTNRKMTFILVGMEDTGVYARNYPQHQFIFINSSLASL